jgi:hypothetical protein
LHALKSHLANRTPELARAALGDGMLKQHGRAGKLRPLAAAQRLKGKSSSGMDVDDRLEHHVQIVSANIHDGSSVDSGYKAERGRF